VTALSDEIDDGPVLFSLLQMREVQLYCFMPSQATGEQDSQKSAVPFALESLSIGASTRRFTLLSS
jgi:hypothetical protein